jgi:hypothetical protein
MTHRSPNAETISHLLNYVSLLLKTYHAECHRNAASRETEFWRGNISGFRYVVDEIYGQDVIHGVLGDARKKNTCVD